MINRKIVYGLCFILLSSCTGTPEKTVHNVYRVAIREMKFQPAVLDVHKGDTVIFTNEDMVDHNVTEASKKAWSSSALSTGKSWKLAVEQSANYYCTIHPVMKGKLAIK